MSIFQTYQQQFLIGVLLISVALLVDQLWKNNRLKKELAREKSEQKPHARVIRYTYENGEVRFLIYWIERNLFLSPAGFTPRQKDAQPFITRGLGVARANDLNFLVIK